MKDYFQDKLVRLHYYLTRYFLYYWLVDKVISWQDKFHIWNEARLDKKYGIENFRVSPGKLKMNEIKNILRIHGGPLVVYSEDKEETKENEKSL